MLGTEYTLIEFTIRNWILARVQPPISLLPSLLWDLESLVLRTESQENQQGCS